MRKINILLSLLVITISLTATVKAQTPSASPASPTPSTVKLSLIQGDVTSINPDKIILQTKDGSMDVILSGKTAYFRVSPDKPSLPAAVASNLTDIGVGDKLIVTGIIASDKKTFPAVKVYLMSQSDIVQKQNKEREEWRTRGITGQVSAVNPQTKEITISSRSFGGERKTILTPKDEVIYRRYAQDSIDYNEAKLSSIDEIKVGDSIRALGDKSEDGATIKAERIVTGSFKTIGGTITAVNTEKNEITITDIQTKKPVTVTVGKNSVLKQFPADVAQRLMQAQTGGIAAPGQAGAVRPPRANQVGEPGQMPNRAGQGGGMRGGNIDDMLERFPNISVADLKVGDMIAVSSTKSVNANRISAIKLLSGVEPFIKAQQQASAGRPRGGVDAGLSIPGLDGSNIP